MLTADPYDILILAHDRARQLREGQAAERLLPARRKGRPLAAVLRRLADRLDPGPLAHRTA